jgi:TOBE domain
VELVEEETGDAEVVAAEYQGPTWMYTVRLASGAEVRSLQPRTVALKVGARVTAHLTTDRPTRVSSAPGITH